MLWLFLLLGALFPKVTRGRVFKVVVGHFVSFCSMLYYQMQWRCLRCVFIQHRIRYESWRNPVSIEDWFSPFENPMGPQRRPPACGWKVHFSRACSGGWLCSCLVSFPSTFIFFTAICLMPVALMNFCNDFSKACFFNVLFLEVHHLRHFILASGSLIRGAQMPQWSSCQDRGFFSASSIV